MSKIDDIEETLKVEGVSLKFMAIEREHVADLVAYIKAAEEFCRWFAKYPELIPDNAAMHKFDKAKDDWKAARAKLELGK